MKTVLIVDDDVSLLLSLRDGLRPCEDRFRVLTAENGEKAVEILKISPIDLVMTDLKMPKMTGFELAEYLYSNHPSIPVLVITSSLLTDEIQEKMKNYGVIDFIEKPVELEELTAKIVSNLSKANTE